MQMSRATAKPNEALLSQTGPHGKNYHEFAKEGWKEVRSMKHPLITALAGLTVLLPGAALADSTNASAKVTLQTSYLNVLGPISASTAGTAGASSGWQTVLEQGIKMANNHDLLINASFEIGLYTSTTVSSKNMIPDTSTSTSSVKVRALVDGVEAAPGAVVYGKRTQQLTATLEGAISGCLSIATNAAGGLQIVLNTNCVQPEIIGLLQDTVTANSFIFAAPNLAAGYHDIEIQAAIEAQGDNQTGTFQAAALVGKGTMTAESSRVAKDPSYGYVLQMQ
jgi:hypothetical protein